MKLQEVTYKCLMNKDLGVELVHELVKCNNECVNRMLFVNKHTKEHAFACIEDIVKTDMEPFKKH